MSRTVNVRPLDSVVSELGLSRLDVIKVDVEGAELLVLKGARETLLRFRPVLVLEMNEGALKNMNTSGMQVANFLADLGYSACRRVEGNVEFLPGSSSSGHSSREFERPGQQLGVM